MPHRGPTLGKTGPPTIKKTQTKTKAHVAGRCKEAPEHSDAVPDAILDRSHLSCGVARYHLGAVPVVCLWASPAGHYSRSALCHWFVRSVSLGFQQLQSTSTEFSGPECSWDCLNTKDFPKKAECVLEFRLKDLAIVEWQ